MFIFAAFTSTRMLLTSFIIISYFSCLCFMFDQQASLFFVFFTIFRYPAHSGWELAVVVRCCLIFYIHFQTHPSQSCFMSSVDLHTQYSYQVIESLKCGFPLSLIEELHSFISVI
jgi:hypothetical protein